MAQEPTLNPFDPSAVAWEVGGKALPAGLLAGGALGLLGGLATARRGNRIRKGLKWGLGGGLLGGLLAGGAGAYLGNQIGFNNRADLRAGLRQAVESRYGGFSIPYAEGHELLRGIGRTSAAKADPDAFHALATKANPSVLGRVGASVNHAAGDGFVGDATRAVGDTLSRFIPGYPTQSAEGQAALSSLVGQAASSYTDKLLDAERVSPAEFWDNLAWRVREAYGPANKGSRPEFGRFVSTLTVPTSATYRAGLKGELEMANRAKDSLPGEGFASELLQHASR